LGDWVWHQVRLEAERDAKNEVLLASFLHSVILTHSCLEDALSFILGMKLGSATLSPVSIRDLIDDALIKNPSIGDAVRADLAAIVRKDPACLGYSIPLLYYKGFHAVQSYRIGHHYWTSGRKHLALFLQSRISEVFSEVFAVDIHPGARLGKGLMFDHATSIVIGETCVIEDDFSMLHEVTLGGTGKSGGDRHPKIGRNVMIGAGAKVLGNIKVGEGAKVGAGSVVLKDVPPYCTVAGVPAVIVEHHPPHALPALDIVDSASVSGEL
jgi:serine O-acetyltransferase